MAFIDLTNVEIVDEVSEDAKVLVEENGEIKRTSVSSNDNLVLIIEEGRGEEYKWSQNISFSKIYEKALEGKLTLFFSIINDPYNDSDENDMLRKEDAQMYVRLNNHSEGKAVIIYDRNGTEFVWNESGFLYAFD